MTDRPLTIAITGASSGIGLRAAERLAADGHRVHAICRDPDRGAAAVARISVAARHPARLVLADLADQKSVAAAADRLGDELDHLDVLVNNAAVFDQTIRRPRFTADGHELFWATNHLGPFRLTAALSRLLAAAPRPRVVTVASKGLVTMPRIRIRFDALDSADWYTPTRAYYHAKLAQVMMSHSLALRAAGRADVACVRVPSVRLDPGRVAAMPRLLRVLYAPKNRIAHPPERIAETYARVATRDSVWSDHADPGGDARAALRGVYLDENERPVDAPAFAYDEEARERLWAVSQGATGDPGWAW
ncbi:SDR family NAD(P)-dependent oxidoreductase [Thermobifida halotolerans]|uniref:SDR family NAD(P)-dependent oxidoreductase n=1 Tax=Thermobifida halotolerans TaxID=483545 RepID=A0A399G720_9ACTN|nr:SDR family NAD(P)-dependent oxidoreductase [Thermobifida halotolerans]UOE20860.1 SDR family NAD(P)-dependent oxidoreductase [Thermobifida halotolerans]